MTKYSISVLHTTVNQKSQISQTTFAFSSWIFLVCATIPGFLPSAQPPCDFIQYIQVTHHMIIGAVKLLEFMGSNSFNFLNLRLITRKRKNYETEWVFSAEIFVCFQAKNLIFRILLSELKYNPCSYTPMSPLFSIHLPPSNFFLPETQFNPKCHLIHTA